MATTLILLMSPLGGHTVVASANQAPIACFDYYPKNITVGTSVNFNAYCSRDNDGYIMRYSWTFGDGAFSDSSYVYHAYSTSGYYTVTLRVTDNSSLTSQNSTILYVATNPPPVVNFTYSPAKPNAEQSIYFQAQLLNPSIGPFDFLWDWGDGTSDQGSSYAYHTYDLGGSYSVTLTVRDATGGVGKATRTVLVNFLPELKPVASPQTVTVGRNVVFDGSGSIDPDGKIMEYRWYFSDLLPLGYYYGYGLYVEGVNVTRSFAQPGTFAATLFVEDDKDAYAFETILVTVLPERSPAVILAYNPSNPGVGQTIAFDATASAPTAGSSPRYLWEFGDGGTASGPKASHAYGRAGTYAVRLVLADDAGIIAQGSVNVTVSGTGPNLVAPAFSSETSLLGAAVLILAVALVAALAWGRRRRSNRGPPRPPQA